jgi:predicted nucleic acid-binding protein
MYLVDTNVWLERLLDQEKSKDVEKLLSRIPSDNLFITDFAFHSISTILVRFKQPKSLLRFVKDIFVDGAVSLIRLQPGYTKRLVDVIKRFQLDYDDAYQYLAAEINSLEILSFDQDFDRQNWEGLNHPN